MPLYEKTRELVDDCVKAFMQSCDSALIQARGEAYGFDGISNDAAKQNARLAWSALQRARLFIVDPDRWRRAWLTSAEYVMSLAGISDEDRKTFSTGGPIPDHVNEAYFSVFEDYGWKWPFPEPLPFDSCFFAYGLRLKLEPGPELNTRMREEYLDDMGWPDAYLIGHLLAWEGETPYAFSFIELRDPSGKTSTTAIAIGRTYFEGEWDLPRSFDPWILSILVRSINDHKQIVDPFKATLGHRLDRKKASKTAKGYLPLPSPFYVVNLTDELIGPPELKMRRSPVGGVEWSHRWDVRGHECVRIERGTQPLAPKDASRMVRRGYRIYQGTLLSEEDASRLSKRGIKVPARDEWIAILSYWRESCIKGPKDKPYIPAARSGV